MWNIDLSLMQSFLSSLHIVIHSRAITGATSQCFYTIGGPKHNPSYILHHVHEDCQGIAQKRQNRAANGSKIHSEVPAVDIKSPRKTAIARASSRKSPWQIYLSVLEIPTNKFAPVMGIASYACVRSELLLDGLNYTIIASH